MNTVYRKELKFPASMYDFARVDRILALQLQRDAHCRDAPYCVRSLYFDSLHDRDLEAGLAGMYRKGKVRLRVYAPDMSLIKLEHKLKAGSDQIKHSFTLSREQALEVMRGNFSVLLDMKDERLNDLYLELTLGGYRPKVIVEYERLAYLYDMGDIRITYDWNVRAAQYTGQFFEEEIDGVPIQGSDSGVLEVKYNQFLPSFLKETLKSLDKLQAANSKYITSRLTC
ncbi:MAG: polyphosphate polymerase domain-containing protein [Eubacteriales bacterium]|nr:polyphosphate polymerase domain-containing protein [Eubacteriales bacterium]